MAISKKSLFNDYKQRVSKTKNLEDFFDLMTKIGEELRNINQRLIKEESQ